MSNVQKIDFSSDQEVRWCPGCGDYAILAQMKKVLAAGDVAPEDLVFISGIGCSSRFPYYLNTYGIHGIHGRAPAIATGLKSMRPDLQVWVVTGDGDALSIGCTHLLHALRRNIDIKILLFNNRVYGLTKGQFSPTSPPGMVTGSTPYGTVFDPLHPLTLALASGASFVARSVDTNSKHLAGVLERASRHRGSAFVEIYQNCNIFNDGAFDHAMDPSRRQDHVVELEHGQPLVFGAARDKGLRLNGLSPEVVALENPDATEGLIHHDETAEDTTQAALLARLRHPEMPEVIGVLRAVTHPTYNDLLDDATEAPSKAGRNAELAALLQGQDSWVVG